MQKNKNQSVRRLQGISEKIVFPQTDHDHEKVAEKLEGISALGSVDEKVQDESNLSMRRFKMNLKSIGEKVQRKTRTPIFQ